MQQTGLLAGSVFIEILINVFFCLTLIRTLNNVREENRTIQIPSVWLYIIPLFNLYWLFIIVFRMASSLKNELLTRDYEVDENPGYKPGLAAASLPFLIYLIYIVDLYVFSHPYITFAAGFFSLLRIVFFVQYWMKMSWYRKVLEEDLAVDKDEEA